MADSVDLDTVASTLIHDSARDGKPDLTFLHFNDVYHIEPSTSKDPIGGAARFISLINHYQSLSNPLMYFSGDAYNPSLESSVTKGRHMVPILNKAGTSVACLGNHDLDFGVTQFQYLAGKCNFPWLCANVEDPEVGVEETATLSGKGLGNTPKTVMLEQNGVKVGVLGLVEREWLDTINTLPPGLVYTSATKRAKELIPLLRAEGAEIVVVVSHQREPNDMKLAENLSAHFAAGEGCDIILGGHDHHYAHSLVTAPEGSPVHVLRSGSDFRMLSYLTLFRRPSDKGWDITVIKRDIIQALPEDAETKALVDQLTSGLKQKLQKPIGVTKVELDARFTTVRTSESNLGNWVCDLMRYYYGADVALMAGGTIRGDTVYSPGTLKLLDIVSCFPFEDPVVVIKVPGRNLLAAIENGLSKLPALEGRFPHVSGMRFEYDSSLPAGERILKTWVGDDSLDLEKVYSVATRGYMANGKDGFDALMVENGAEFVVDDENGVLISMILRQYFLSLKVVGKWTRGGCFRKLFGTLKMDATVGGTLVPPGTAVEHEDSGSGDTSDAEDDEYAEHNGESLSPSSPNFPEGTREVLLRAGSKWKRLAGVGKEEKVDWTDAIAPRLEGRIVDVCAK